MKFQNKKDLEDWYKVSDPWGYEKNKDDLIRKKILLSEIPNREYVNVLDIGCGEGFITKELPGEKILGVDISENAISFAKENIGSPRIEFLSCDLFDLPNKVEIKFDLIIITGVLYSQYIGNSNSLIYLIIDQLLKKNGVLVSVHIDEWYKSRFPYLLINEYYYSYREYSHILEVYQK
ncbi:class I SAM-dependent methyltransferase [Algoriphagus marincola]|uniref:class I SAM-dependent methyltransferase n=1 Tax=Algoriphagus marincola TaxID=264027 RepID=UPI000404517C|nr:methyltransferase domain-containing protein [Algoriphagus marincola]